MIVQKTVDYYYFEEGDKYLSIIVDLDNYNLKYKKNRSLGSDKIAKHIISLVGDNNGR